jgi:hypothetical protein
VIVAAYVLTNVGLLILVGAVAVWRAAKSVPGPGNFRMAATFAGLVATLSALAMGLG